MRICLGKAAAVGVLCLTLRVLAQTDNSEPRGVLNGVVTTPNGQDLPIAVLLDRTKIEEGQSVVLTVALTSPIVFTDEGPGLIVSDALQIVPLSSVDGRHLRRYGIKATAKGEYSILLRGSVKRETDNPPSVQTLNRLIALTVNGRDRGVLAGNAGVVIGAVLGIASSFFGLYFKEWLESRASKREQVRWLCNELVGRLEAARLNVRSGQAVDYSPWMEDLYSKYFATLRKWDTVSEVGESLAQEVIQIEGLLRQHNQNLTKVAANEDLERDLDERIARVQGRLAS